MSDALAPLLKEADATAGTSGQEAEIDQLVHALYGLTAEEIAVVEGNSREFLQGRNSLTYR